MLLQGKEAKGRFIHACPALISIVFLDQWQCTLDCLLSCLYNHSLSTPFFYFYFSVFLPMIQLCKRRTKTEHTWVRPGTRRRLLCVPLLGALDLTLASASPSALLLLMTATCYWRPPSAGRSAFGDTLTSDVLLFHQTDSPCFVAAMYVLLLALPALTVQKAKKDSSFFLFESLYRCTCVRCKI